MKIRRNYISCVGFHAWVRRGYSGTVRDVQLKLCGCGNYQVSPSTRIRHGIRGSTGRLTLWPGVEFGLSGDRFAVKLGLKL